MDDGARIRGRALAEVWQQVQPGHSEAELVLGDAHGSLHLRARVLEVEGGTLATEHPRLDGEPAPLEAGTGVGVCIGLEGVGAVRFETVVEGPWLGADGSEGVALQLPESVERIERRPAHRVATGAQSLAVIREAGAAYAEGWVGEIRDVSESGCAVELSESMAGQIAAGGAVLVMFRLPDDSGTRLELPASEVRRQGPGPEGGKVRIGLKFEPPVSARDPARAALARSIERAQRGRRAG